jgi:asparagine synthase (glutamine-hydrolysing)
MEICFRKGGVKATKMCGIAGKYHLDGRGPVDGVLLTLMTRMLSHRGPDGEGYYLKGPIGLGHRRLSIIDLEGGRQPISNEDGSVWVILNGEIYNFRELRSELEGRGHRFSTKSDTEAIVHLYEEHGVDCVQHLWGMFAFALWDCRRQRLLLARDRLGKKPLYYAHLPGRSLTFGSELKSVLSDPEVPKEVDLEALDRYLSLLYVPAPQTIFQGVQKLPAGHVLVADRHGVAVSEYWDLHFPNIARRPDDEYTQELLERLTEAVRARLVSDVPLGAFLSGGLDSSTIVGLMARVSERPVVTASVGFHEARDDERPWARLVAERFGCDARESEVNPNIRDLLPKLVWHFDEPFADSSAVPTYYVSKVAREHVTVALSGDGGDELFAGYARHFWDRWEARVRLLALPPGLVKLAARVWPSSVRGKNALMHLAMGPDEACARKHSAELFREDGKHSLYSDDMLELTRGFDPLAVHRAYYRRCEAGDPLNRSLYVDLKTYLADDILVKVDRMSMAHGLEVRAPFLDHHLVEFVAALSSDLKLRGRTTKFLLRKAMRFVLPMAVLSKTKHGFEAPIAHWMRHELRELVEDVLLGARAQQRGLFNLCFIKQLWGDHLDGVHNAGHQLWLLLMLELWFQQFMDRSPDGLIQ